MRLALLDEKQCDAALELAVTMFLQGDDSRAAGQIASAFEACSSRDEEVRSILRWELRRLGNQTPALAPRSKAIVERFLTVSSHKFRQTDFAVHISSMCPAPAFG